MEKEITTEYTNLRCGLVQFILQDYLQSILFEQQLTETELIKQIEQKLKLLRFDTVVSNLEINEDGSVFGAVSVDTGCCGYKIITFNFYPTGAVVV